MTTLVTSEVFGPTVQGEGPHLGQRVAFVRLGGCNLHCTWCDTPYTWDATRYDLHAELTRQPVATIVNTILTMDPHRVIISGGEPLLHQRQAGWHPMLRAFRRHGLPVDIETNGTVMPSPITTASVSCFVVSPKLDHAGDPPERRHVPHVLATMAELARRGRAVLKVVVVTPDDVHEARRIADQYAWPLHAAYVMPEGTDAATLLRRHLELGDTALDAGINMTTRLHILTWGSQTGR